MELFKIPDDIQNVLIHTDVLKGMKFPIKDKSTFLELHHKFLLEYTQEKSLFFPSFNYSCLRSGKYIIHEDKVQVGVLNEYLRGNELYKRDLMPVFNFISNINDNYISVENNDIIDPFGINSTFGFLNKNKSYLLHYGSNFNSSTIIHYIERISEKLVYRYDKQFLIEVVSNDTTKVVKLNYHVRPLEFDLEYDWKKLEGDLKSQNLIQEYKNGRTNILGIKIDQLVNYWIEKLCDDPLYLLDEQSKYNVLEKLDKLGSKFELKHFE